MVADKNLLGIAKKKPHLASLVAKSTVSTSTKTLRNPSGREKSVSTTLVMETLSLLPSARTSTTRMGTTRTSTTSTMILPSGILQLLRSVGRLLKGSRRWNRAIGRPKLTRWSFRRVPTDGEMDEVEQLLN